jgi:hypothetical protein
MGSEVGLAMARFSAKRIQNSTLYALLLPDIEAATDLANETRSLWRRHGFGGSGTMPDMDYVLEEQVHLDRLHEDHQEIDAQLKGVQAASELAQARRLLKAGLLASRQHFAREERDVFPLIEEVLSGDALTELEKTWRSRDAVLAS